jgi:hypothetical protein
VEWLSRGREGVVVQMFSASRYWRWRLGHTANLAYEYIVGKPADGGNSTK